MSDSDRNKIQTSINVFDDQLRFCSDEDVNLSRVVRQILDIRLQYNFEDSEEFVDLVDALVKTHVSDRHVQIDIDEFEFEESPEIRDNSRD